MRQFYTDSYTQVRFPHNASAPTALVMQMHDAFKGVDYWAGFLPPPAHEGVILDSHIYQMFSDAVRARALSLLPYSPYTR